MFASRFLRVLVNPFACSSQVKTKPNGSLSAIFSNVMKAILKSDWFVITYPTGALMLRFFRQTDDGRRDIVGPAFSSSSTMSWKKSKKSDDGLSSAFADSPDIFLLMLKEHFV